MHFLAIWGGLRRNYALRAPEQESGGPDPHRQQRPESAKRIAVALIDDRALFGESLATAMNDRATDLVVKHWKSVDALASVPSALQGVDLVLICIGRTSLFRGSMSRLIKVLLKQDRHLPIAILADTADPAMVATGRAMGLRGILSSKASLDAVATALRQIYAGGTVVPNEH
ncbi:DNA-binding response regulator [Azospirillum canadense]|uniref:DNA-binding response regulator n=1 Tax=Azospirillum canadense TaxID=403962 RepID=UPI0022263B70|nr:DNA-binding response regulator [Azospirillum canadense]MCW2243597.1 DNA-binding NarL/FixJ family response regulator [Azospirillum canadense]